MTPLTTDKSQSRLILAIPLICVMAVVALCVAGIIVQRQSEESVYWQVASAFFLIPLALEIAALFFLWKRVNLHYYFFNLVVMTICLGSCYLFWLLYSNNKLFGGNTLQYFSLSTLIVILILIVGVGIMTYAIMRPSSNHLGGAFCTRLNEGIRSHPFWAIAFFFTLFIGVAYLFGFSLAFHDKYSLTQIAKETYEDKSSNTGVSDKDPKHELRPALRMDNHKSIDDWAAEKPKAQPTAIPVDGSALQQVNKFNFYFESNEADLKTEMCKENSPPERSWSRDATFPSNEGSNDCHLGAMIKKMKEEIDNGKRIRVTLVGHSDNEPVGPQPTSQPKSPNRKAMGNTSNAIPVFRYVSNYELSGARADNVKYQILKMFPDKEKLRNIEWLILSASNEELKEIPEGLINQNVFEPQELANKFAQDQIAKGISAKQLAAQFGKEGFDKMYRKMGTDRSAEENRVVLASIEEMPDDSDARPLGLVDYMYFSIYTITTTGYGDIKPTTAYAKFVTSIANFCEVLFLVVFFNALISLRPRNDDEHDARQVAPAIPVIPRGDGEMNDADAGGRRAILQGAFRRE
jgi:Ion channel